MGEYNVEDVAIELSPEEKAVADKAAKLITRNYGEVLRKLGEE